MQPFLKICTISLITALLAACSAEPELDKKTQLINTLQVMETAIEDKNLDDFMAHLSPDFSSDQRGWNKTDTERLLRLRMMRKSSIHIHQLLKRLDWLDGGDQQAEAEVVVAVAGTEFSLEELPGLRGDLLKFTVTFKRFDNAYLVTQTTWTRATPADFVF